LEFQLASSSGFAFASQHALRQSRELPRTVLAPALSRLRRVAEARKSRRIAKRFAALGGINRAEAFGQDEGPFRALLE
jgi:hypothetical protein